MDDTTWQHSGQAATYFNWYGYDPDSVTQVCAVAWIRFEWADWPCASNPVRYICEKEYETLDKIFFAEWSGE